MHAKDEVKKEVEQKLAVVKVEETVAKVKKEETVDNTTVKQEPQTSGSNSIVQPNVVTNNSRLETVSRVNNNPAPETLPPLEAIPSSSSSSSSAFPVQAFTSSNLLSSSVNDIDNINALTSAIRNKSSNAQEAFNRLSGIAAQGNASAQYNLGWLYKEGHIGLGPNYEEAAKWFRAAANQGHAMAKFNLGWLYKEGHIGQTGPNYEEAARCFRDAANQGVAPAQFNLGLLYGHIGQTGPNYEEAARCFRAAANQGHARAQYNLGWLYTQGHIGRSPDNKCDYAMAAFWLMKAVMNIDNIAKGIAKQNLFVTIQWF